MDGILSEKHRIVRRSVRSFCEREIRPIAGEIDREARFPWEVVEKMGKLGYFGIQAMLKHKYDDGSHLLYGASYYDIGNVRSTFVGFPPFIYSFRDVRGTQAAHRLYFAKKIIKYISPMAEHINDDTSVIFFSIIP